MSPVRWFVGLVMVAGLLGGCGTDDDGGVVAGASTTTGGASGTTGSTTTGGETTTTDGGEAAAMIELTIERTDQGMTATLTCPDGDAASAVGTGWLTDRSAAQMACTVVLGDEAARQLLLEGPPADRMCTQIYGGPEKATVTGTIDGEPVQATFGRTDGCGIDDWSRLQALFGSPDA